jgi:hypothetical protein
MHTLVDPGIDNGPPWTGCHDGGAGAHRDYSRRERMAGVSSPTTTFGDGAAGLVGRR